MKSSTAYRAQESDGRREMGQVWGQMLQLSNQRICGEHDTHPTWVPQLSSR